MANNIFDLDFTGVESYNNLGEGTHNVKVASAEFSKAGTGSDQLTLRFEDGNGATKMAWLSLVPQALWKVKQFLEAIGIDASGRLRLDTRSLVGKTLQIVIEQDPNDESRLIITKYNKVAQAATTQQAAPVAPIAAAIPQSPVAPAMPVFTPPTMLQPQPAAVPQQPAQPAAPVQQSAPDLPPWMQPQAAQSAGAVPPWMIPQGK